MTITCIEELRCLARKRVPKMFYDYVDAGSWTEYSYRVNQADLQRIEFRQRVAMDISQRSTASSMVGQAVAMPMAIAPTGLTGMVHPDGEILAARAAKKFGIPFTLSTMSICSIEAVAQGTDYHPFWFQLYVMRDRNFVANLIERAKAANCAALVVTMDLQVFGQRHKDIKNGLSTPPKITLRNLINIASKPRWCRQILASRHRNFGNIIGHASGVDNIDAMVEWTQQQFDPCLSWHDVEWIKQRWGGKLIVKGIMEPEDARLAVQAGADAVIVSNHGGRQLDGVSSSISQLPLIVDAVKRQAEVHFDGGIRSGQDVLKAIALGAKGTYIGRSMLYGLGAMGEQGVTTALNILRNEFDLSMAFCGKTDVASINADILRIKDNH